jgi:flagellar hook-basal body complex protein FliE
MDPVRLKPFDFAQAAARAGLRTDGQPLGRTQAAQGSPNFATAIDQAHREP